MVFEPEHHGVVVKQGVDQRGVGIQLQGLLMHGLQLQVLQIQGQRGDQKQKYNQ